jgi:hypothetical protein
MGTHLAARASGPNFPGQLAGLGVIIGGAGLAVCWYRMSGEPRWQDQIAWLIAASGLVLLAGVALAGWILTEVRRVRHESALLMSAIRVHNLGLPSLFEAVTPVSSPLDSRDAGPESTVLVANASMTRKHKPDCLLVQGKQVQPVTDAQAGLKVCGVCCR